MIVKDTSMCSYLCEVQKLQLSCSSIFIIWFGVILMTRRRYYSIYIYMHIWVWCNLADWTFHMWRCTTVKDQILWRSGQIMPCVGVLPVKYKGGVINWIKWYEIILFRLSLFFLCVARFEFRKWDSASEWVIPQSDQYSSTNTTFDVLVAYDL